MSENSTVIAAIRNIDNHIKAADHCPECVTNSTAAFCLGMSVMKHSHEYGIALLALFDRAAEAEEGEAEREVLDFIRDCPIEETERD